MTKEVDNYLEHYGVKGMRWGRRSAVVSENSPPEKGKKAKAAVAIGAATLGVVGFVVLAKSLEKSGNTSVSGLSKRHPSVDLGREISNFHAATKFDAKVRLDPEKFDFPKQETLFSSLNNRMGEQGAGSFKPNMAPRPAPKAVSFPKTNEFHKKQDSLFSSLANKMDEHGGSSPKPAPKAASFPKTKPAGAKPKAPSAYPMTPLIPTPILDEINRRYGW
jgi:hypothetical protein